MNKMNKNKQSGFTLVEMSVVLVVIGLILGAVSIGKDVQRNAEYTKLKQKFIDQWATGYNEVYARSGTVLGDSQVQPTFMVAGYDFTAKNAGAISGNDMTGVGSPGLICQTQKGDHMALQLSGTNGDSLHTLMDRLGIRMPPGRAEGSEDRYLYLDSNGNPQEVQVCFQWNPPTTSSGSGNVMVISGLTPELARELDHMIDGKPDAREGMFRQEDMSTTSVSNGVAGVEWSINNTFKYSSSVSSVDAATPSESAGSTGVATQGENKDENQVQTVVAHYKMNQ